MRSNDGACAGRQSPSRLAITLFPATTSTAGTAQQVDVASFFEDFVPVREGGKGAVALWSPATFAGNRRLSSAVLHLSALVLDYDADGGAIDPASILRVWSGYEVVVHSTYTPGSFRAVLPYDRPVTPQEHAAIWAWARSKDPRIDPACKDPSRMYFLPTEREDLDDPPLFGYTACERLAVDRLPVDLRAGPASRSPSALSDPRPYGPSSPRDTTSEASAYAAISRAEQREDLALIEERCAFMRHAREDAATLPEPEWYAALSIVARCKGADTLAHDISRDHPQYTHYETEQKYQRAKGVGPATCAHIRGLSSACEGCPLSVTSPVLLGRMDTPNTVAAPDLDDQLRDARATYQQARVDEDGARVALERAKRNWRAVRSVKAGASEDDVANAVRAVSAAEEELRIAERIRVAADKHLKRIQAKASLAGLPPGANPVVWGRLHIAKDRPAGTIGNAMLILGEDPKWSSRLSYNAFSLDVCLDQEPLAEERATEITAQLSYDYAIDLTTPMVGECLRAVARRRSFHPVQDWLRRLSWDGVSRVRDLMWRGFGATPDQDMELVALLGERFILSILGRALHPGAKVDTMLVLVGAQGGRKSTALEALVGEAWFGATKLDLANKDSFMQMRGKMVYEIGEMEGIKRADANLAKHWLSSRIDTYRAPYARRAEDHPRQTVIVGSTNEDEILLDPTGFRRYWPVRVSRTDPDWIVEHRDQLFAEAMALRDAGRVWWFDEASEESTRLRRHALPYQQVHPWTEVIYEWVAQRKDESPFSVAQVMRGALGQMVVGLTQSEATIVGTILKHHLGCPSERSVESGRKVTVYRRPEGMRKAPAGKVIQMA